MRARDSICVSGSSQRSNMYVAAPSRICGSHRLHAVLRVTRDLPAAHRRASGRRHGYSACAAAEPAHQRALARPRLALHQREELFKLAARTALDRRHRRDQHFERIAQRFADQLDGLLLISGAEGLGEDNPQFDGSIG